MLPQLSTGRGGYLPAPTQLGYLPSPIFYRSFATVAAAFCRRSDEAVQ